MWIVDLIMSLVGSYITPIVIAAVGVLGIFLFGAKKKREGKQAERDRVFRAQMQANQDAEEARLRAAVKTPSQKRKEVDKWAR